MIAKAGLDGHDRGAKVVVRALREAGFEVVYSGLHLPPERIGEAAAREGVDVLGLSILSGAHLALVPVVMDELARRGAAPVVIAGGILPEADLPALRAMGVAQVFLPGTPTGAAVDWIRASVRPRAAVGAAPAGLAA